MRSKSWIILGLLLASTTWAGTLKTGGSHPTVTVQVESTGSSLEEAKQRGFRSAVEQVVGVVVITDTESSGDQLVKDFIGSYSAGFVDDYQLLETQEVDNKYKIKMSVTVASSKIAQRMLNSGSKSMIVFGERLQAQIDSQLDQRARGDRLIAEVLSSYPYNAYVPEFSWRSEISNTRNPSIVIRYDITMSKTWLDALDEALDLVAVDSSKCGKWTMMVAKAINNDRYAGAEVKRLTSCGSDSDITVANHGYYFADDVTLNMINQQIQSPLGQQHIGLIIEFLDAGGIVLDSRCARINTERFISYRTPKGTVNWNNMRSTQRPKINQDNVYGELVYKDDQRIMGDLARIKLNVQQTCT
jgi:hypothetical protein